MSKSKNARPESRVECSDKHLAFAFNQSGIRQHLARVAQRSGRAGAAAEATTMLAKIAVGGDDYCPIDGLLRGWASSVLTEPEICLAVGEQAEADAKHLPEPKPSDELPF